MPRCYQTFHGIVAAFNEDLLIDGMAVLWHLLRESQSHPIHIDETSASLSRLWAEEFRDFVRLGLLRLPLKDWLRTRTDAEAFVAILDKGIGLLRRLGSVIPRAILQAAVSKPGEFGDEPPTEPYIGTIIELRRLISQGSQNLSLDT